MLSRKTRNFIALALFFSTGFACSTALYIPDEKNTALGSNLNDLKAGRKLYVEKCGSCHALVLPEKHTPAEWRTAVEQMQAKSKITDEEKTLILSYLSKGNGNR